MKFIWVPLKTLWAFWPQIPRRSSSQSSSSASLCQAPHSQLTYRHQVSSYHFCISLEWGPTSLSSACCTSSYRRHPQVSLWFLPHFPRTDSSAGSVHRAQPQRCLALPFPVRRCHHHSLGSSDIARLQSWWCKLGRDIGSGSRISWCFG